MNKDNEPTRVCGCTLIQSKAVQDETSEWIRKAHPNFVIYRRLTLIAVFCGGVGWFLNLHQLMPLVFLVPLLVYLTASKKLLKEYNEQAPDELKLK